MHSYSAYAALVAIFVLISWLVPKTVKALTGPLSKIPGPVLNRWSNWPLKIAVLRGQRVQYTHALHLKYGNCVRIAPDEVALGGVDSAREIYRIGGGFRKSTWYAKFTGQQTKDGAIFTLIDPKAHAFHRKQFAKHFTPHALQEWQDVVEEKGRKAVEEIKKSAKSGPVNMFIWWGFMANDVITELSFGESFHALENGKRSAYSVDLEKAGVFGGIRAELGPLVAPLHYIPLPSLQHFLQAPQRMDAYSNDFLARNKEAGDFKHTFFGKILDDKEAGVKSFTDGEVTREARSFIVAGTDTTAVTMTYLLWAVMKHPAIHKRLQDEVDGLPEGFSVQQALALPYLHKVLEETLRLYGPASAALPRVVPQGGKELSGYYIPEGKTVAIQAYSLHRDPTTFPKPEVFDPDRWDSPTQDMKDAYLPWGGGTRICLGMNLAKMEICFAVATFLRECKGVKISPDMTDEDMEFENYFLSSPKSHKCDVIIPRA